MSRKRESLSSALRASDHLLRVGCTVGLRRHSGIDPRAIRRESLTRTQARRTLAKKLKWNRLLRDDLQMHSVWSGGAAFTATAPSLNRWQHNRHGSGSLSRHRQSVPTGQADRMSQRIKRAKTPMRAITTTSDRVGKPFFRLLRKVLLDAALCWGTRAAFRFSTAPAFTGSLG